MAGSISQLRALIGIDHRKIREFGREDFMLSVKRKMFSGANGVNQFGLMK